MPQTKTKYDSKSAKSGPSKTLQEKEQPKLRASAQEFRPTLGTEQPIEFQDFPIPSDEYVEYDYNPYLAPEADPVEEFERKPLRECDKLEGLDFSTFVVFSNVKNIPLEMQIAEAGDGPARLRLCTFGNSCIRRTIDCPYTHIFNDEGNWDNQDENVPYPREELDDKPEGKASPRFRAANYSSPNTSHLPTSISFVSTTSIASTLSSSSLTDDSSIDSSDSPSISPPDSPSRSSSSDSSTELHDIKRQERKAKSVKVVKTMAPSQTTTRKPQGAKKVKHLKVPKTKGKSRPIPIKTK